MKNTKENTHAVQTVVCSIRSHRKNDNDTREAALAQRGELYLIHPLAITFPSKEEATIFMRSNTAREYIFLYYAGVFLLRRKTWIVK